MGSGIFKRHYCYISIFTKKSHIIIPNIKQLKETSDI